MPNDRTIFDTLSRLACILALLAGPLACGVQRAGDAQCRVREGRCETGFVCTRSDGGAYECQEEAVEEPTSEDDQGFNDVSGDDMDIHSVGMPRVRIVGKQLLLNDAPFHMKGVNWNPVPRGGIHPRDLDFAAFAARDAPLMQAAGINVVRTFEPITDTTVLDVLMAHDIYVLSTVYPYGGVPVDNLADAVNGTKNHPAILMWAVGNEWNFNGLHHGLNPEDALARVGEAARLIKMLDPTRPVATSYGELPPRDIIERLPEIDAWGLNVYRGIGFGRLFEEFESRSEKPMFLAEYGADAYNSNIDSEDQPAQAEAVRTLTSLIVAESAVAGGSCLGGIIFEWADEWHKAPGDPNAHDSGGYAPGGGPHPDGVFNEEWWGLVDIDRNPRMAYRAYLETPLPMVEAK